MNNDLAPTVDDIVSRIEHHITTETFDPDNWIGSVFDACNGGVSDNGNAMSKIAGWITIRRFRMEGKQVRLLAEDRDNLVRILQYLAIIDCMPEHLEARAVLAASGIAYN